MTAKVVKVQTADPLNTHGFPCFDLFVLVRANSARFPQWGTVRSGAHYEDSKIPQWKYLACSSLPRGRCYPDSVNKHFITRTLLFSSFSSHLAKPVSVFRPCCSRFCLRPTYEAFVSYVSIKTLAGQSFLQPLFGYLSPPPVFTRLKYKTALCFTNVPTSPNSIIHSRFQDVVSWGLDTQGLQVSKIHNT